MSRLASHNRLLLQILGVPGSRHTIKRDSLSTTKNGITNNQKDHHDMREEIIGQSGRRYVLDGVLQDKGMSFGQVYLATHVSRKSYLKDLQLTPVIPVMARRNMW